MSGRGVHIGVKGEAEALDAALHAHRAAVYELFSRLLVREPDAALLEVLRDIGEVDTADGPMALGWELLRRAAGETDVTSARREYNDLFIGLGRGELVPFGSWYLTGFLMEKPLAVLRAELETLGIERESGVVESEDHVAALSDAMAILIHHPEEVSFERQRRFFDDHLGSWVLRFCDDLQNATSARFYRSVGFFGQSFFEFEQRLLSMQS